MACETGGYGHRPWLESNTCSMLGRVSVRVVNEEIPTDIPVRPQGRVAVIARLVWAAEDEEWLPAHAIRWTATHVMVVWDVEDQVGQLRQHAAWLRSEDVKRSIRFGSRAGQTLICSLTCLGLRRIRGKCPSASENAGCRRPQHSLERGICQVNRTQLLFEVEDVVTDRPRVAVPAPVVTASEEDLTAVAEVALWGPLLDRLNVVAEADRRALRPIGPGGYSGRECDRALVETQLAGGDFLSDRALLADDATAALRGPWELPSVSTLSRFLDVTDLGRVSKAAAVNRTLLRRAWAAGAGPAGSTITIDPDATRVATYGAGKQGSAFDRHGQVGLSPLVGVCGETGDVLAVRARG